MKKLLILVSLLVSVMMFTIQGGNRTSKSTLIDAKTKSSSPIQKFLSFFACAALEKKTPKTRHPFIAEENTIKPRDEDPTITIAPEDIDHDLLDSPVCKTQLEKEAPVIHCPPTAQKEISKQSVEDKNIERALIDSFLFGSCDGKKRVQKSAKVHVEIETPSDLAGSGT